VRIRKVTTAQADRMTAVPHHAEEAARHLLNAFTWAKSREGRAYWEEVYDRLCAIADAKRT
jgi:hypothetical protein